MEHKICRNETCHKAGKPQPLTAFYVSVANNDGRQSRCIECEKEAKRIRYKDDLKRFTGHNIHNDSALPRYIVGILNRATRAIHEQANQGG